MDIRNNWKSEKQVNGKEQTRKRYNEIERERERGKQCGKKRERNGGIPEAMEEQTEGNGSLGSDLKNGVAESGVHGGGRWEFFVLFAREKGEGGWGWKLNRSVQPPLPPFKLEKTRATGSTGGSTGTTGGSKKTARSKF